MNGTKNGQTELPTLTLNMGGGSHVSVAPSQPSIGLADDIKPEETRLTEAEQKLVDDFAQKIDLTDSAVVLTYGSAAQNKIAEFADSALQNVKTQDLGETGEAIVDLVGELQSFSPDEKKKKIFGIFRNPAQSIEKLKARYDTAEESINKIVVELDKHQMQLLKDISVLDKLYEKNLANYKEVTLYIAAGKKKLFEARETTLAELRERAQRTGHPEDAQSANDFQSLCERFEKKLHDLELTRMVAVQSAPQIRMVQNNDTLMAEKIQSTIVNTIPLWKSQMVIALGLAHSKQALEAERRVTDMTNELLRRNADALKQGTLDVARESERGVVDIETLTYTNSQLISTLDEVMKISEEGRAKRAAAQTELTRMENELKSKLLEIRK